ncbi:MAG: dethiobiotin synthase [Ginsengibacter sp.]
MKPIFITGTGTHVGKTLVSAIIAESLQADYWKPVQAGYEDGTDSLAVHHLISNTKTVIHPELYRLTTPASPHISAALDNTKVKIKKIVSGIPKTANNLLVEGAGGLLVPLNKKNFVLDLIKKMKARVIIVSKNELGSINHSLLTAAVLKREKINVAGWIFTDEFMYYEEQIAEWSGYPLIASIKHLQVVTKETVKAEADAIFPKLQKYL